MHNKIYFTVSESDTWAHITEGAHITTDCPPVPRLSGLNGFTNVEDCARLFEGTRLVVARLGGQTALSDDGRVLAGTEMDVLQVIDATEPIRFIAENAAQELINLADFYSPNGSADIATLRNSLVTASRVYIAEATRDDFGRQLMLDRVTALQRVGTLMGSPHCNPCLRLAAKAVFHLSLSSFSPVAACNLIVDAYLSRFPETRIHLTHLGSNARRHLSAAIIDSAEGYRS